MAMNENFPIFSLDTGAKTKQKGNGLHPLHEVAMRIADLGLDRPRSKTKDLINVLLCMAPACAIPSRRHASTCTHHIIHRQAPVLMRLR